MRQHKFGDSYRSQPRGFFTEAQFLKFAKPQDQVNLTDGIFPKPDFAANTTTTEVVIAEPIQQFALAKRDLR